MHSVRPAYKLLPVGGFGGLRVSENESLVYFDGRFTAIGVRIKGICLRAPVYSLSRADTFVQTAMSIKLEKKIGCSNTRTIYTGLNLGSCEPAFLERPLQYYNFLKIRTLYIK